MALDAFPRRSSIIRPAARSGGLSRSSRGGVQSPATPVKAGTASQPPNGPPSKAQLVANERWKYLATYLNTLAGGSFAAGVFTPLSALLVQGPDALTFPGVVLGISIFIMWSGVSAGFALAAQIALGKLKP